MSRASSGSRAPSTTTSAGAALAPPAASHPRLGAEPEGDAHRHVGPLAGGRGRAVVDVDVAIDVGDPERPDRRRAGPPARRAPARSSRRAPAVARRPATASRTAARTACVVASVSAMPITPLTGSRSSPRIRTSRSPRSSAPRRAGRSCSRTAAGACSVPPARPTESIGTPMAVQGADTPEAIGQRGRAPGAERRSYPCGGGRPTFGPLSRCASRPGRRSGRRAMPPGGCEPAGRLVHTTVGVGERIARPARASWAADTASARAERRAGRGERGEDLVGVEAAVVPDDQAGPARGREIGDHPVAAGGRDVLGAPKRADGIGRRHPDAGVGAVEAGPRDGRVAARAVAIAIGAWLRFEPSRSRQLGGAEAVARRPHGDLVEDRPARAALAERTARSRPGSSARRR